MCGVLDRAAPFAASVSGYGQSSNERKKVDSGVDINVSGWTICLIINDLIEMDGAPIRIRTRDPLITNQIVRHDFAGENV